MLRCPVCRTRRATFTGMLEHTSKWGHGAACKCGGYHYPHRPGSPCCDKNPMAHVHRALRTGAVIDPLDVAVEFAWHTPGVTGGECPF